MPAISTVNGTCGALAPKRAFTFAKAPVIGFLSVASGTSLTIPITAPADTGGYPVIDYTITSNPATTTKTTSSAGNYTFTGLTPGTLYTFTVKARTAYGTSSDSTNFGLSGSLAPDAVPNTPTGTVSAYNYHNSISCSLSDLITYSGTRPTSYTGRIYQTDNGSGSPYMETTTNASQSQIDNNQYYPGVGFNINYGDGGFNLFKSYSVRVNNAYGSSGWSTAGNFQPYSNQEMGYGTGEYGRYPYGTPATPTLSVNSFSGNKYWSLYGSLNEGTPRSGWNFDRNMYLYYSSDNVNWYYYDWQYYDTGWRYFMSGYGGYYYRGVIANKYATSAPSNVIYVTT